MIERALDTPFEGTVLKGGVIGDAARRVLMLHGAGGSHRGKLLPFRLELLEAGYSTYAFDFVGHGETGGELIGSSLHHRLRQTEAFIRQHRLDQEPLSVIAASMGAHTAVMLTEIFALDSLVLIVPAMYSRLATDVPFGPEFSKILRTPGSFRDADGWDTLTSYAGRVLVVAAEDDRVIPEEVVSLFYDKAQRASSRARFVARGAGHMLFTELRERDPSQLREIVDRVIATLR